MEKEGERLNPIHLNSGYFLSKRWGPPPKDADKGTPHHSESYFKDPHEKEEDYGKGVVFGEVKRFVAK